MSLVHNAHLSPSYLSYTSAYAHLLSSQRFLYGPALIIWPDNTFIFPFSALHIPSLHSFAMSAETCQLTARASAAGVKYHRNVKDHENEKAYFPSALSSFFKTN